MDSLKVFRYCAILYPKFLFCESRNDLVQKLVRVLCVFMAKIIAKHQKDFRCLKTVNLILTIVHHPFCELID